MHRLSLFLLEFRLGYGRYGMFKVVIESEGVVDLNLYDRTQCHVFSTSHYKQ